MCVFSGTKGEGKSINKKFGEGGAGTQRKIPAVPWGAHSSPSQVPNLLRAVSHLNLPWPMKIFNSPLVKDEKTEA